MQIHRKRIAESWLRAPKLFGPCYLNGRVVTSAFEGENIDVGTDNIEIAEFLLTQEVFTSEAEMTCHVDQDRDYMLTVRS